MMNRALVGKEYAALPFSVEEDGVRRFAAAVGEEGASVPPTFATAAELAALAQVVGDPELHMDFARVVHGEQEYEWDRPLSIGDVLSVAPRIAEIRARAGHEFLVVETQMRDAAGERVLLARSTLIARGSGAAE